MLISCDPLGLLHEQGTKTLMLELPRISGMYRNSCAVDVELSDHAGRLAGQLLTISVFFCAFAQSKKRDKDVLLGILVGEESLPSSIGGVVATDELDLVWSDLVLDLVNTNLSGAHIAASGAE